MDERKWEDLNVDCLVNVFVRAGMESLLLDVPLVCKSWYKVTLNPHCWERLIFPKLDLEDYNDPFISRIMVMKQQGRTYLNSTAFIKSVINRSRGCAVTVQLPVCTTVEDLIYVADECPGLKVLVLPRELFSLYKLYIIRKIPSLVKKWKHLEGLGLGSSYHMPEILAEISVHCKNFNRLCVTKACIGEQEASSIVVSVPSIKHLFLRHANIEGENLVTILKGCKELVQLDVKDCIGFDGDDEKILKLASHIGKFTCEGSKKYDWDDDFRCSYRDDGFHDGNISD